MTAVLAQVDKVLAPVDEDDDLEDPALRACVQFAFAGPCLVSPAQPASSPPLTVSMLGMHLHAATIVDGRDHKRLERVCRYLLRPPFAHDAVQALPDGRVRIQPPSPPPAHPPAVCRPVSGQQRTLGLDDDDSRSAAADPSARPCRIGWARLLARVFAVYVTVCRKCGPRMHILDVVTAATPRP